MSPVLYNFKGSFPGMPGISLDNANGGPWAGIAGPPCGGEQGGPAMPAHGPGRCLSSTLILDFSGRLYLLLGRSATDSLGYLEPVSWNVPCSARASNRLPRRFGRRRLSRSLETLADVLQGREGD